MSDTLYRREPGTAKPNAGQLRAVWGWLSILRVHYPNQAMIEGGIAAAEWVTGLSNVPPVTAKAFRHPSGLVEAAFTFPGESETVRPATNALIAAEINAAADEAEAPRTAAAGAYAVGVNGFLSWWTGIADLPAPFVPDDRGRLPDWMAGAA